MSVFTHVFPIRIRLKDINYFLRAYMTQCGVLCFNELFTVTQYYKALVSFSVRVEPGSITVEERFVVDRIAICLVIYVFLLF